MHEEEGVGMGCEKSKILVLEGTGYLGKYMVKTSVSRDHPTYAYVRPVKPNTDASKLDLHHRFESMGASFVFVNCVQVILADHIKFEFVKESSKREQMLFYAARLNFEEDVVAYTLKAAVDPRTSNKVIINRPPGKYRTSLATVC